jgi:predicted membrane protein
MDRHDRKRMVSGLMIQGQRDSARAGLIWGALICAAGVALLLDHMGFIAIGNLFRFWPMILVAFGIGHVFTRSGRVWGVILIVVGAVFQLNNLGITHMGIGDLWPVAIIAVGLVLIWGALRPPVVADGNPDSVDVLNAVAVFGGCERRVKSPNFKGGRTMSLFGGVELDLRDAKIEGDVASLEINCIFGGVEIRVPDNWYVDSKSIPIMGGYSDKTHVPANDNPLNPRKTLQITGTVVFGGVEITN